MKILMVIHGFAPECSGGTESYVLRLCQDLRRCGHEVQVFCGSHEGSRADGPRLDLYHLEGMPVHRVHRSGLFVDNWEKGLAPEVAALLARVLDATRPDLVHVHHWIRLTRNLVETCHDRGIPAVCTLHDLWTTCPRAFRVKDGRFCELPQGPESCTGCALPGELRSEAEIRDELRLFGDDFRNELALARRVIVPSNAHKDVVLRHHPSLAGRLRVVPHGNLGATAAAAPARPDPEGRLRIGHWGHLSSLKGIDLLLEAVAGSRAKDHMRLELFGGVVYPDERPRIDALAAGLDAVWHGPFAPSDLARVPMDLAVIPSRCHESWSFVLDEAFLLGLPAIVPASGALAERLGGAGAAFRPGDAEDLRARLEEVIAEPERLARWKARIPRLLPMRDHLEALERVYREVTSLRAPLATTPAALRERRLAARAAQVERRLRERETDQGVIENLRSDARRAAASLAEMQHYHEEKDREIGRLRAELDARSPLDEAAAERAAELERQLRTEREEAGRLLRLVAEERARLERLTEEERRAAARMLDVGASIEGTLRSAEDAIGDERHASLQALSTVVEHIRTDGAGGSAAPDGAAAAGGDESLAQAGAETRKLVALALDHGARLQSQIDERDELLKKMAATVDGLLEHVELGERRRRRSDARPADDVGDAGGRLRILFVVHQFLPRHVAGTEVYTWRLAKELAERHDVTILTAESDHSRHRFETSRRTYDGLPVVEMIHNYRWTDFRDTYDCPEADSIFRRVLREVRPHLMHVQHLHYFSANFVTIARSRGIPVVYTLHDYMLLCPRDGILLRQDGERCLQPVPSKCADCIREHELSSRAAPSIPRGLRPGADALVPDDVTRELLKVRRPEHLGDDPYEHAVAERLDYLRRVLKDVDLFIAPSRFLRERFVESGLVPSDRVIVSDNGLARNGAPPAPPRLPRAELRVGYVGTIGEHKGAHLLVEAMNGIDDPRVSCRIWGDLRAFEDYAARLRAASRNPRTMLMGPFPNQRLAEVLRSFDVLAVPSLWFENAPLTIREAALAGIPVVVSDIGGLAESVRDGVTGLHFRAGDAQDLRAKLLALLDDHGPLAAFDPRALEVKAIADDAREMEARYRRLLETALARV